MAWLHENREEFFDAVNLAAERHNVLPTLSKCHKVIKRFSEDIDITIDIKLSQGQMKKLKETIKTVAEELGLRIPNIEGTRSRRSYSRYILEYDSVPCRTG